MADVIDQANHKAQLEADTALAHVRAAAARIPAGQPGECDLCGEWTGRIVDGACATCRDRHSLP